MAWLITITAMVLFAGLTGVRSPHEAVKVCLTLAVCFGLSASREPYA
jgi:hypothetical protein